MTEEKTNHSQIKRILIGDVSNVLSRASRELVSEDNILREANLIVMAWIMYDLIVEEENQEERSLMIQNYEELLGSKLFSEAIVIAVIKRLSSISYTRDIVLNPKIMKIITG